jgi:hypothetical protein
MSDADALARVLGGAGLGVAAVSLGISVLTYRRAGARVKVEGRFTTHSTYAGQRFDWEVFAVRVRNKGLADVQVEKVELELKSGDRLAVDSERPSSSTLEKLSALEWSLNIHELAMRAGTVTLDGGSVRFRPVVTLGNGAERRTRRWFSHTVVNDLA